MKKCPRCKKANIENNNVCTNCGNSFGGGKYLKKSSKCPTKPVLIIGVIVVFLIIFIVAFGSSVSKHTASSSMNGQLIIPEHCGIDVSDLCYENQELYVDSQLLLTTDVNTDYDFIDRLVKTESGQIIGYIPFSGDYHIDFPNGKSYHELAQICQAWKGEKGIESVSLRYAYRAATESVNFQNDPWNSSSLRKEQWTEAAPDGNNWWAEAVCLPSVWGMDIWENVSPVKVGVIDTIFAEQHKDLENVIVKTWQNDIDPDTQTVKAPDHGTHVSGLIAAEMGNGVGIAGVASCASPQLYCFSTFGNLQETYITDQMHFKYAIALMLEEGVKVINISMGNDDDCVFAAQQGNIQAQDEIKKFDEDMSVFLKKALSAGFDFLIVKGAGNTSGYGFVECPITGTTPYGYEVVGYGTEGSISQNCSANFDWFAGITDPSIRERIIVVGAVRQDAPYSTNYTPTYFSNSDCDVYAPGESILSLVYGKSSVDFRRGTSQAAPIVTGIAALVWSVDPNLTAVQVKEIIQRSVPNTEDQGADRVSIVNAAVAVYFARQWGSSQVERDKQSVLMGTVYETVTTSGEKANTAISDVKATLHSGDLGVSKTIQVSEGQFCEYLSPGQYSVSFEVDGYVKQTVSFELLPQEAEYLSVQLTPEDEVPEIFSQLPETFTCITSSLRVENVISLEPEGSFLGTMKDPDWGNNTPEYPMGTTYLTEIYGRFADFEKVSDCCYRMVIAQAENTGIAGQTYISGDVRYIVKDYAYLEAGDVFELYLPGTPRSELPQGLIDSVNNNGRHSMEEITPDTFVLYHAIPGSNGYDLVFIGETSKPVIDASEPEQYPKNSIDIGSTFGYEKAWDIHDYSGADHMVTSLAFQDDGTFCCGVGYYLSEWYVAFTGTYEVANDEITLRYTQNGKEQMSSYRVNWADRSLTQTSKDNLIISHPVGSEYQLEENPWYTAVDLMEQVELIMRYAE